MQIFRSPTYWTTLWLTLMSSKPLIYFILYTCLRYISLGADITCFLASLGYLAELTYLLFPLEKSKVYVTLHLTHDLSSFRKQIRVNLSLPIQTITILILIEKLEVILFQLFAQSETVIKWRKVDWTKVLLDIKSHVFFLYYIAF